MNEHVADKVCGSCRHFTPKFMDRAGHFLLGTCYLTGMKKLAPMTSCAKYASGPPIHRKSSKGTIGERISYQHERKGKMTENNETRKERTYKDKDGLVMRGVATAEILGERIEVLAKRLYEWDGYEGLAIKAKVLGGEVVIIECMSNVVKSQLTSSKCPKPPFAGVIETRESKKGRTYHTFLFADD